MPFWKKPHEVPEWLAGVAFFEGFSTEELARVAELSTEVEVGPGALLIDQGDPGMDCFVIVEGTANVYIAGEHVATLGPGSMIGEMALIGHRPRTASVVAETDMKLLRFDAPRFRKLLSEMPKAEERVTSLLLARRRANN
jgi:CRP/FNR family cyclic AMP-dependent transcriptional regulator